MRVIEALLRFIDPTPKCDVCGSENWAEGRVRETHGWHDAHACFGYGTPGTATSARKLKAEW